MEAVLKTWAEKSGLEHKWPEEAAAEKPEGMEEAEKPAEGEAAPEMAEGGEEAAAEGEAKPEGEGMEAAAAKMSLIAPDAFGEATGPGEIPKLLLSLMFLNPVFGDAVKAETMFHELGGGDGKDSLAAVAAVVGAYVNAGEKAEADSFGCAWLSGDDFEELDEVAKAKDTSALVFPGIVGAWSDEADAMGQAGTGKGT